MLILFDHGAPRGPVRAFGGHTVITAQSRGWDTLNNGALLKAAEEAGADLVLTTDRRIRYQQNLAGRKIAIVVLTGTTKWSRVRLHDGFLLAGDRLVQALIGTAEEDAVIYSILTLYRHHVELELKGLVRAALSSSILEESVVKTDSKVLGRHGLKERWAVRLPDVDLPTFRTGVHKMSHYLACFRGSIGEATDEHNCP